MLQKKKKVLLFLHLKELRQLGRLSVLFFFFFFFCIWLGVFSYQFSHTEIKYFFLTILKVHPRLDLYTLKKFCHPQHSINYFCYNPAPMVMPHGATGSAKKKNPTFNYHPDQKIKITNRISQNNRGLSSIYSLS